MTTQLRSRAAPATVPTRPPANAPAPPEPMFESADLGESSHRLQQKQAEIDRRQAEEARPLFGMQGLD